MISERLVRTNFENIHIPMIVSLLEVTINNQIIAGILHTCHCALNASGGLFNACDVVLIVSNRRLQTVCSILQLRDIALIVLNRCL